MSPSITHRTQALAREVEEVDILLPQVALEFARVDAGERDTIFRTMASPKVTRHFIELGFTMAGAAHVADEAVVAVVPLKVGSSPIRWDGVPVPAGELRVYGPGYVQEAVDPSGCRLALVEIDYRALSQTADTLGLEIPDLHGRCLTLSPAAAAPLTAMLRQDSSGLDDRSETTETLRLLAHALTTSPDAAPSIRRMSSTRIVCRALEYLAANDAWLPPMVDLCAAAFTSERRLRSAFVDCYGMPPTHLLRHRALSAVRDALLRASPDTETVAGVASKHGFRHMGAFAHRYRQNFGERPSETLRAATHRGRTHR